MEKRCYLPTNWCTTDSRWGRSPSVTERRLGWKKVHQHSNLTKDNIFYDVITSIYSFHLHQKAVQRGIIIVWHLGKCDDFMRKWSVVCHVELNSISRSEITVSLSVLSMLNTGLFIKSCVWCLRMQLKDYIIPFVFPHAWSMERFRITSQILDNKLIKLAHLST